jgi:hypothetical protein
VSEAQEIEVEYFDASWQKHTQEYLVDVIMTWIEKEYTNAILD